MHFYPHRFICSSRGRPIFFKLKFDRLQFIVVLVLINNNKFMDSIFPKLHNQFLAKQKYLHPLKAQENATIIESQIVDEIFLMVPTILKIHQQFLDELRCRLDVWEPLQRVGDAFVQVVSTSYSVLLFLSLTTCYHFQKPKNVSFFVFLATVFHNNRAGNIHIIREQCESSEGSNTSRQQSTSSIRTLPRDNGT